MNNSIEHNQFIKESYVYEKIERLKKECSPVLWHAYYYVWCLDHYPVNIRENSSLPVNQYVYREIPISRGCGEAGMVRQECNFLAENKKIDPKYLSKFPEAIESGLIMRYPEGHTSASFRLLFKDGFEKRKEIIESKYKDTKLSKNEKEFYYAIFLILHSIQKKIGYYADIVTDENKKKVLLWLKRNPPRTFYEGIVLIALFHEFARLDYEIISVQGVRLDQLLYPYYERDCKTGILDRDKASKMLEDLFLFFDDYGERCANITVGGCSPNGENQSNELTELILEVSEKLHLDVPLITLRVHPKLPDRVWDKALKLVSTGVGFPAFYNDQAVVKAKINAGVSKEDAFDYGTLGCVETTIGGREYSQTEGLRLNWLKLLEIMLSSLNENTENTFWPLHEYRRTFDRFEDFYGWYREELEYTTNIVCHYVDMAEDAANEYWPQPFLSAFVEGALEKGRDITNHGAKYETLCINGAGIASTVDSLQAIEEVVFKRKEVSLSELEKALRLNFKGYESLRKKLQQCPKFGNDIECVDFKAADLMKLFTTAVNNYKRMYGPGKMQCGFYTVMHHYLLGQKTGASPDGRLTGEPLSNSLSASQGADKNGPTAIVNSVNKISTEFMGNGMALDMKFLPSFLKTETHRRALKTLIQVYFARGGMEVQLNVVDKETLLKAQKEPEKYRHLVVRVSGYSAYFVNLERGLQDEIIGRTAYGA